MFIIFLLWKEEEGDMSQLVTKKQRQKMRDLLSCVHVSVHVCECVCECVYESACVCVSVWMCV